MVESRAAQVQSHLLSKRFTLSLAESCTGGNIASLLTKVPGASDYFHGGIVAYTPEIKTSVLGVMTNTIELNTIVSEEVATEMAIGAKEMFKTSIAVSTTGVAGPTGGTEHTPVGTVCMALVNADSTVFTQTLRLSGTREQIIVQASQAALAFILERV